MFETEVTVESAGARLAGTLCLPERGGQFPLVVMIHGTGPLDRDENFARQRLNVFNSIAHRLATVGVASIRYDKRGCGKSGGDIYRTGHSDLVKDVIAWVDAIAAGNYEGGATPIFLLGHSEGSIIAPQVFAARPSIAGMALLSPFVQSMEAILLRQAATVQKEVAAGTGLSGAIQKTLIKMVGGATVKSQQQIINRMRSSTDDVVRVRLKKVPARAVRELLALDPPAIFSKVTCPALLVGGAKDMQCDPADVAAIAASLRGPVESHVVPDLTHLLRIDPGEPSLIRSGALLKNPTANVVLDLVGDWFRRQV